MLRVPSDLTADPIPSAAPVEPDGAHAITRLGQPIRSALARDLPFHGVVTAYIAVGTLLHLAVTGRLPEVSWFSSGMWALAGLYLGGLVTAALWSRKARNPGSKSILDAGTWGDIRRTHFPLERVAAAVLALLVLRPFFSVFSAVKQLIPAIRPFAWDARFAGLDRALHGGVDPWLLLQPALGTPWMTHAIDSLYVYWFPLMALAFIWQAFSGREPDRSRFLLAFALTWIVLGSGMATLFSSAGPCYYGAVVGGTDPFAPLMAYLSDVDATGKLAALHLQDVLWRAYMGETGVAGSGISAMPSLHVAIAVLTATAAWRAHRGLGALAAAYALIVLVGSVHLGWHYAVDGYVAAVLTVAIWYLAGWLLHLRPGAPVGPNGARSAPPTAP